MSERHLFRADYEAGSHDGFTVEKVLALLNRAHENRAAPKALTGCVSEISSCAQEDRSYAGALKEYAAAYEAAQAYLAPGEGAVWHDYAQCAQGEQDAHGAQVAAQLELLLRGDDIEALRVSDEEVEGCGYLAWLRH